MQKLRNSLAFRAYWNQLRKIQEKRTILLVTICCLTLAICGGAYISWLGRVNRTQREQVLTASQNSLGVLNRSLRREVSYLLTVFRAEPRWDPAERVHGLAERYFVWHESSGHGPLIERILLYDMSSPAGSHLQELKFPHKSLEPVGSEHGLEDLRVRLLSNSSRYRKMISPRWLSTWLYYPDSSTLVRPVGALRHEPGNGGPQMSFVGYLVIQLDFEYVSRRILPDLLRDHLRNLSSGLRVDVAFTVDGQVTHLFRAAELDVADRDSVSEASFLYTYTLAADGDRLGTDWVESADASRQIMLTTSEVPHPVARIGGIQRIALRWITPDPDLIEFVRYRTERKRSPDGRVSETRVLPFAPERPRLFLGEGRRRNLDVVVKHVDSSLEEALAVQHSRSLAMGAGLLLILGGAMALVVVSLRRASHLANMRLEFAAAISHELRTPVAAIRAMGDNIAEGILGTGKQALLYGELIRDEGQRLSEMIEHTLKFVALDSGLDRYEVVPLDVSAVVDEAAAYMQPIVEREGFILERSAAVETPPVLADETALRQSLRNLLSNAVKYGLPGRWVKLELATVSKSEQREVEISVHDRGPGIPPKEQHSIFEPYYRALGTNDSTVAGSGLGLNLAKRMVHGMGGRLTLRSVPGQGSVFTIHLPVAG